MNDEAQKTETIAVPKGMKVNAEGHFVPVDKIKPIDLKRDKLVSSLIAEAKAKSGQIAEFRERSFKQIDEFVDFSAAEYDTKIGGKKGNMTLFSYDGKYKIVIANSEYKTFDERLQVAKHLVDECLNTWMKGSNKNIQVLVQKAFQVDKQGNVSIRRILELRQYKIDDPRWTKAMDAIADAIQITGSKRYVRYYERIGNSNEYRVIPMDAANA